MITDNYGYDTCGFCVVNEETHKIEVWNGAQVSTDGIDITDDTVLLLSGLAYTGIPVLIKKSYKDLDYYLGNIVDEK